MTVALGVGAVVLAIIAFLAGAALGATFTAVLLGGPQA